MAVVGLSIADKGVEGADVEEVQGEVVAFIGQMLRRITGKGNEDDAIEILVEDEQARNDRCRKDREEENRRIPKVVGEFADRKKGRDEVDDGNGNGNAKIRPVPEIQLEGKKEDGKNQLRGEQVFVFRKAAYHFLAPLR